MDGLEPKSGAVARTRWEDFKTIRQIGAGAFGVVYEAIAERDLPYGNAGDRFALKLYHEGLLEDPAIRERVEREFATGLNLRHPNLVRFYDLVLDGPKSFLVMEFCDGLNLIQWAKTNTSPSGDFLLQFATEMLEVLEFIHSSSRIHRDLKPTNISLDKDGRIRLLDYGLILDLNASQITTADRFVGTYQYAAPETIFETDHDKRYSSKSDLYSLGATLYFLLYGVQIFDSVRKVPEIIAAKKQHRIFLDRTFPDSVQDAIHQLCRRLLEKDPNERPPNAPSCWELLAKAIPSTMPFRVYYACALTSDGSKRQFFGEAAKIVKREGVAQRYKVYVPGEHTDPLTAPAVTPTEVYWIDRERVASSDLVLIMADHPSFGVGQEAEIAANAGVPLAIFHSPQVQVSKMLKGLPGQIISTTEFHGLQDLQEVVERFFRQNKERLSLSRISREREYHLRVGNRVRHMREVLHLSVPALAGKAELNVDLIKGLESRPEQQSNFSLVNLRKIARALEVSPAELIRDQSSRDEEFATLCRNSTDNLRAYAKREKLSYEVYENLKISGKQNLRERFNELAWRGAATSGIEAWSEKQWREHYMRRLTAVAQEPSIAETLSLDFSDDSLS
jgi:transcriptional regulator with XRE-family HTH domain